jgi:hypothetical protein
MRQASKVVVLAAAGATQVSPSLEEPYSITGIIPYPSQGSVSRPLPGLRPCAPACGISSCIWRFQEIMSMCACERHDLPISHPCHPSSAICKTLGVGQTHTQATQLATAP